MRKLVDKPKNWVYNAYYLQEHVFGGLENLKKRSIYVRSKVDPTFYLRRFHALAELGFTGYHEYLQSDLWKSIRQRVLDIDSRCWVCLTNEFVQVHHLQYTMDNLRGDTIDGLIPLCKPCHIKGHYDEHGKKIKGLPEVNRRIRSLRKSVLRKSLIERGIIKPKKKVKLKHPHEVSMLESSHE